MEREKRDDLEKIEDDLNSEEEDSNKPKRLGIILLILIIIGGAAYIGIEYLPSLKEPPEEVATPPPPQPQPVVPEKKAELPSSETVSLPSPEVKKSPVVVEETPPLPEKKYAVQIGTYVFKHNMDMLLKELKEKGFKPYENTGISEIKSYRVEVGEFQDAQEVRNIVKKLIGNDIEVKFKVVSKGLYTLSAGDFFSRPHAEEFKNKLIEKGYPARFSEIKEKKKVYILRIGNFKNYKEAKEMLTNLSDKGINSIIVKLSKT